MVLQMTGIIKSYDGAEGPVSVLGGVDLDLGAGETLALTGESGSGKSTLLHIAAGLEAPDEGEVIVAGEVLSGRNDAARAAVRRTKLAVVFQQFNLIPSLSVRANIAFHARIGGKGDATQIEELAEALGLGDQLDKYPEALSGGQQQRVAIARALAAKPPLILADEPTGNLDEATAARVLDEMLALTRNAGAALLMVTHSPSVAARMDRQVHLSGGQLA